MTFLPLVSRLTTYVNKEFIPASIICRDLYFHLFVLYRADRHFVKTLGDEHFGLYLFPSDKYKLGAISMM